MIQKRHIKKLVLSLILVFSSVAVSAQNDLNRQLWRNTNIGWDVYRTENYRWRNIFVGSGYFYRFETLPKMYAYGGMNMNWSKYTLYGNGSYALMENNAILKTTSLTVPLYVGYQAFQTKGFRLNLYTGPAFEMILASKLDGYSYDKINRFQTGWTMGSTLRFLYLFRARVAYSYYPTSLLTDFNMPRSAFTLSVGF